MSPSMNSNKMILALVASLLPLATIACGGAPSSDLEGAAPAASASASQNDGGAPNANSGSNNSNSNSTSNTTADAGSTSTSNGGGNTSASDAGTTATTVTFSANCNTAVSAPELCAEDVTGTAGEIITVPVDLLGTIACPTVQEAWGHLVFSNNFLLANPVEQLDCITRDFDTVPVTPDTTEVIWDHLGGNSSCPNQIVSGRVDMVQVEILPGTPAGDYPITWNNEGVASPITGCAGPANGIAGTIHVN